MALQGSIIKRSFKYNGLTLTDPLAEKTADQVRKFYASQFPELINSVVEGPVTKNGVSTYTFIRAVGSKGLGHLTAMRNIVGGISNVDINNPMSNSSLDQIKKVQQCSKTVRSVVDSSKKSTPLIAPASAYSRFG